MVLGPTEIEDDILQAGAFPQEYMRTTDYSQKLHVIFKNLQYLFSTTNPVLIYACSGTGIMEAAVVNSCSSEDYVLVINGGSFGQRWKEICLHHDLYVEEITLKFGESVNPEIIKEKLKKNPKIKAVFTTLNETSSGALTDLEAIGKIVNSYPQTLLICDCVSGLIVEPMEMDKWHVDIAITSSQKALALPPGLAFMALSTKAQNVILNANLKSYYFNAIPYLQNWKRDQTPFTPPVSLLSMLELRLRKIRTTGLQNIRKQYQDITKYLRDELKKIGFETFAQKPACAVTGIWIKDGNALEIIQNLREKYHIEIAPSGGEFKNNFLRIGNFGNISYKDIDCLIAALKETLDIIGAPK